MKPYVLLVAALLIGGVFGAGAMYYYREAELSESFAAGMAYQQSLTPAAVTPASLTLALNPTTIDHTATVGAAGGVAAEVDVSTTLTITNNDGRIARAPVLMLYNPLTSKEGLHSNLQEDETMVSVTVGGVTSHLYYEDFTSGIVLADIPINGVITVTVTFTLEEAVDGTYQDGQSHAGHLFVYQPTANYCDSVSYTLTT